MTVTYPGLRIISPLLKETAQEHIIPKYELLSLANHKPQAHMNRPPQPTNQTTNHLSRPPLDKLLQITSGGNPQHKPTAIIRNHGELLPLAPRGGALEEGLELLERCVHRDDLVLLALALEPVHCVGDGVLGPHLALVQQRLQVRDGDVAQQGAGLGVDDGQVGVVALEGGEEGEGDGVGGVEGEGGWRLEVFYCGLDFWVRWLEMLDLSFFLGIFFMQTPPLFFFFFPFFLNLGGWCLRIDV